MTTALVTHELDYDDFIKKMEQARLEYGRAYRQLHFSSWFAPRPTVSTPLPPIDLKAYITIKQYDLDKQQTIDGMPRNPRTFAKIITELVKHKDQLHPYIRRFIIERMREAEGRHRRLAEQYGCVADQFE